jgi:hypothetical protein
LKSGNEPIITLIFSDKWFVEREGGCGDEAVGNQQAVAETIVMQQVDGGVRDWHSQFDNLKPLQEAIEGTLFGFFWQPTSSSIWVTTLIANVERFSMSCRQVIASVMPRPASIKTSVSMITIVVYDFPHSEARALRTHEVLSCMSSR